MFDLESVFSYFKVKTFFLIEKKPNFSWIFDEIVIQFLTFSPKFCPKHGITLAKFNILPEFKNQVTP